MTIDTKYNIGDKVYYLNGYNIDSFKIESLRVIVHDKKNISVVYSTPTDDKGYRHEFSEEYIFPSKEELISTIK